MLARSPKPSNFVERACLGALDAGVALYARYAAAIGAAILTVYILGAAVLAVVKPDANWDMLPYLAVAEEGRMPNPADLHAFAYSEAQAAVSPGDYKKLVDDGGGYRSRMAADPEAFHSMLGMYRVKFLYAETLSAMSAVLPPVTAMRVLSAIAALLLGGVALVWLRADNALALGPAIAAVLMVAGFGDAARAATPDLLGAAFFIAGLFAYTRRREAWTAALLFLAFMMRPDNLVAMAVLAVMVVALRVRAAGILAAFGASLAAYFAISAWAGHPGWWPHLYFTAIEQQLNMDGFAPAFSLMLYAKAFARGVVYAVWFNSWVGVLALALACWFGMRLVGVGMDRRIGVIFAALVLAIAAKFTIFPIHDTRIYFPMLVPLFLLLSGPIMGFGCVVQRDAGGPRVNPNET